MVHELLRRGHREILWSRWRVAESRIEPTCLDQVLPDDARVLFRWEGDTGVDHDDRIVVVEGEHVLSDLAASTEGDDF